jgi:hypothetical protein
MGSFGRQWSLGHGESGVNGGVIRKALIVTGLGVHLRASCVTGQGPLISRY